MQRIDTFRGQPIQPGRSVVCDGAMAVSLPSLYGQEAYVVLVRSHGGWNSTGWIGGEFDQADCATLPPKINAYLKDACTERRARRPEPTDGARHEEAVQQQ